MIDNPTAFPFEEKSYDGTHWHSRSGMTLRDYYVGQVMPSVIIQCAGDTLAHGASRPSYFARVAGELADAMLAERAKATCDGEGV